MPSKKETVKKTLLKIKVSKNGPYLISDGVPIQKKAIIADKEGTATGWRKEAEYPATKCTLCRCGQSQSKPFCDGTHAKIKFDGTETANEETYLNHPEEMDGPTVKLSDAKELCASARFCHRAGGIWYLISKSDDPEKKQVILEEGCDCPSGRLVVFDKKTQKTVEPKLEPSIVLIEDPAVGVSGPIWVRGGVPVESADGKTYRVRNRVTLCRCGKSANKPFCDSSHYPE